MESTTLDNIRNAQHKPDNYTVQCPQKQHISCDGETRVRLYTVRGFWRFFLHAGPLGIPVLILIDGLMTSWREHTMAKECLDKEAQMDFTGLK
jgi:hypothetical protein